MKKKYMISDYIKNKIKNAEKMDIVGLPYTNIREFAKYTGISHTVVHDILNGKYNSPSPLTAVRMCKWFDLEPDKLFDMITIKGNKELFLDKFYEKYSGQNFENRCSDALLWFVNSFEKFDENEKLIFLFDKGDDKVASLSNFKKINFKENSVYDPRAYNAECTYRFYDMEYMEIENEMEQVATLIDEYTCMLYYLPTRRIIKKSKITYADEEIRDFTNKFFYLIKSKDAPLHNVFITSSKLVYDEIVNYLGDIEIKPTTPNLGITLVYQPTYEPYKFECMTIINNDDDFLRALLPERKDS